MKHLPPLPADAQLQPASPRTRAVLFALMVGLPLVLISFDPKLGSYATYGGVGASFAMVALLAVAIWLLVDWSLRRQSIKVDEQGITVTTTFYQRQLSWPALDLAQARVVNPDEHTEFKLRRKTNGTSLPGFKSGWYRLRNGSKALVAIRRGERVAWLPTGAGYGLLLEPARAQSLLDYLKRVAPRHPAP